MYFAAREAIRNAVRHGRTNDTRPALKIVVFQRVQKWEIVIENNCAETSQPLEPGSGQGLTLHSTLMATIGGELSFEQIPGEVTRVVLRIPSEI